MEVKKPTTYEEQIGKLSQRGCIIDDKDYALRVLKKINYYRLTAYFLPFKTREDTYKAGTTFSQVIEIYKFDRDLRSILFPIIEEIELMLRARLAYYHAHKYGALGYLDKENFNNRHQHEVFEKHIEDEIKHNDKQLFVQHHKNTYGGKFPIWVIIELLSIGELSYFYSDLIRADKKILARELFRTTDSNLSSWLMCLTYLRNTCAHYSRLYYNLFPATPRTPENFPIRLGKRLFDYIVVLKFLFNDPEYWNEKFITTLSAAMEQYEDSISLEHIGFPNNWKQILTIK